MKQTSSYRRTIGNKLRRLWQMALCLTYLEISTTTTQRHIHHCCHGQQTKACFVFSKVQHAWTRDEFCSNWISKCCNMHGTLSNIPKHIRLVGAQWYQTPLVHHMCKAAARTKVTCSIQYIYIYIYIYSCSIEYMMHMYTYIYDYKYKRGHMRAFSSANTQQVTRTSPYHIAHM